MSRTEAPAPLRPALFDDVDFIDLGASLGGSLDYCAKRFGGTGVGIDVDAYKVSRARAAGHRVILADARRMQVRDAVRFVSALDFFEHLPGRDVARDILASAAAAASDFIFIRHPSFEGEAMLRGLGVCQYWHDWVNHPNHLRVSDYCSIFAELGLNKYAIRYVEEIDHTSHPSIIPVGAPPNQQEYDAGRHGPKPEVALDEPVWRLQHIFVALRDLPPDEWDRIVSVK